jgi:hypothetical protein
VDFFARDVEHQRLGSPLRSTVRLTLLLGSPRIFLIESSSDMPLTGLLSRRLIRSPGLMPARQAGESSIGATILM